MADKPTLTLEPGQTNTCYVIRKSNGGTPQYYNGSGAAFENYNASNIATYGRAMTEGARGNYTANSNFPAISAGEYVLVPYVMATSSLATTDDPRSGVAVYWDTSTLYFNGTAATLAILGTPASDSIAEDIAGFAAGIPAPDLSDITDTLEDIEDATTQITDLLEADLYLDQNTSPWSIQFRRRGTTDQLIPAKSLKTAAGTNITGPSTVLGRHTQVS